MYSVESDNGKVKILSVISQGATGPQGIQGIQGEKGDKGDQGITGATGISGVPSINLVADQDLGVNRVVKSTISGCNYANNQVISDSKLVLGFTMSSILANNLVSIQTFGEMDGFGGLVSGSSVYLGENGLIVQSVPVSGFVLKLGTAISSTKVSINIQQPIILG